MLGGYPFGRFTADTVEFVRHAGDRVLWKFLLQVATPYERLRRRRRAL
jgi:hypothetical protein